MEKEMKKPKTILGKLWFILWEDDSLKGWLISLVVIFLFIKFIFFPGLNFVTQTELPMAIVESCSMYHENDIFSNTEKWFERHESKYSQYIINYLDFRDFKFSNGFNKGDILFIIGVKPEKIKIGDVIIFNANRQNPIIHRVINIKESNGKYTFSTIGDNNDGQLSTEQSISEEMIIGKAVFKIIPFAGWAKLIFFEPLRSESERGLCQEN